MILDLHTHSVKSDDGRAKVENYCQWIKAKEIPIDGFVLTEHRQYDFESDYSSLEKKYNLLILKGSEVETEYGHVLIFGVTEMLTTKIDFSRIDLALRDVIHWSKACSAVAVPCHPGRPKVGMFAHTDRLGIPEGVEIVETLNGGSRDEEDRVAIENARSLEYKGIGGSDSHIVSHIGRCATIFTEEIRSMEVLVKELKKGNFEPISLKNSLK